MGGSPLKTPVGRLLMVALSVNDGDLLSANNGDLLHYLLILSSRSALMWGA